MYIKYGPVFAVLCLATPAFGATLIRHNSVTVDANGNPTEYTETVTDSDGNLLINTRGVKAGASTVSEAGGSADVKTSYSPGAIDDVAIYQAREKTVLSVDGDRCQKLSADSPPPPGMPPGGLGQYQDQLSAAQKQMNKAFEEMAKTDPEMAKRMRESMGAMIPGATSKIRPRNELELVEPGDTRKIGKYNTTKFDVVEPSTNTMKYTVYATKIGNVDGGEKVGRAMQGMFNVYKSYMNTLGAGSLANTNLMGVIMDKMRDYYPILTIDHSDNSQTRFVGVERGGNADFYPQCTEVQY